MKKEKAAEARGEKRDSRDDHEIECHTGKGRGRGKEVFAERGEALTTDLYVRSTSSRWPLRTVFANAIVFSSIVRYRCVSVGRGEKKRTGRKFYFYFR